MAPGQRSPLTSIGAFTDLNAEADPDDPRGGSGFDAETYFQNVLASKLAECTRAVMVVFRTWVEQQKLAVSKIDERPGQLLAFVPVADRGGIFELSYRVDTKRERARTSLYFYSKDGSQHQPASLKAILQEYEIERLQDNLQKALLCGDN